MTLKKKLEAFAWHQENGVFCGTCVHFKSAVIEPKNNDGINWTYCEFAPHGPAKWPHEYCNLWEANGDAEGSL